VHHSGNPKHFNKNFGSCLALWDWMFGTLYVPQKEREPLIFGFADHPNAHTVQGELVEPLINAAAHLKPLLQKRRSELAPVPVAERKQA
jgi:sterol desaturase/sphingolipid hydroxylase (fatty acid hydroxylase superfamily)